MKALKSLIKLFLLLLFCFTLAFSHNPKYVTPSEEYHIVKKGETLYSISKKYDTTVEQLKRINQLESNTILVGQKIYLNEKNRSAKYYVTRREIPEKGYHVVKKGQTLYRISRIYDLTVPQLMQYNKLSSYTIKPEQKIWLQPRETKSSKSYSLQTTQTPTPPKKPETVSKKVPDKKTKSTKKDTSPKSNYHVVQKGETLYSIATRYDMTIYELKHLNNLASNRIFPGQKLYLSSTKAKEVSKVSPIKSIKLLWPCKGTITNKFGMQNGKPHKGIDIACPVGTAIKSVADGEVVYSKWQRGYGHVMILKHKHGLMTVYAHNKENFFNKGDKVSQGDKIASVGTSGNSSGPHLHFELRLEGRAKDPLNYLP
ncbi:MAG: LysM peptidoglycan-binding domain-containing protein [Candidatus Cloacimonetes bacterium]|nr:LysM peptidoglycan-binding domain-containing protein [Candidatus Cloacimonadota bacterium]MBS3767417.1 LysM peptidoglycan-binding domain-containing protein [Candidatus Cloacimonadota bacterium]